MGRSIFIPPGGFQGFAEQTIATKQLVAGSSKPKRKVRRKTAKKKPAKRARRRPATPVRSRRKKVTRKKKPARLVKGSAAAKRHMAKLRKMRRR